MPLGERRRGGPYLFDLGGIVSGEVPLVIITDVMSLADGRVGAFVVDRSEGIDTTVYVMFSQEGDRWLIDDLIEFSPSDDEMDGN
jgi:hypothetical protein